jgi:hypothetical protein
MNKNNLSSIFLICVASSFVLVPIGCGENKTQIELKKAIERIEIISKKLGELPLDSISSVRIRLSEAKDDLQWLGIDSNVVFVRSDSKVIEELSKASRYLKDTPNRLRGLLNEIGRCRIQLSGLGEAIVSGADIDSLGDTINGAYIKHNARVEIEAVEKLESVLDETLRLIRLGLETDSAGWSAIDSLLLAKKGQWARGISENEAEGGL